MQYSQILAISRKNQLELETLRLELRLKNLPLQSHELILSFAASLPPSCHVYVRKFKTWPGQKILAVSMQDTSAFAIRNSRSREGTKGQQHKN